MQERERRKSYHDTTTAHQSRRLIPDSVGAEIDVDSEVGSQLETGFSENTDLYESLTLEHGDGGNRPSTYPHSPSKPSVARSHLLAGDAAYSAGVFAAALSNKNQAADDWLETAHQHYIEASQYMFTIPSYATTDGGEHTSPDEDRETVSEPITPYPDASLANPHGVEFGTPDHKLLVLKRALAIGYGIDEHGLRKQAANHILKTYTAARTDTAASEVHLSLDAEYIRGVAAATVGDSHTLSASIESLESVREERGFTTRLTTQYDILRGLTDEDSERLRDGIESLTQQYLQMTRGDSNLHLTTFIGSEDITLCYYVGRWTGLKSRTSPGDNLVVSS